MPIILVSRRRQKDQELQAILSYTGEFRTSLGYMKLCLKGKPKTFFVSFVSA